MIRPAALEVWSSCTTVFTGGLPQVPAVLRGRGMILVADRELTAHVDAVRARAPALEVVLVGSSDPSGEVAASVAGALARRPGGVPVALGGGTVMDLVRLAALAAADPAADGFGAPADGPTVLPTRAVNPTVCIPTTIGTAAEVSAVAVRTGPGGTAMIVSPGLRSAAVVLDPALTGTLPTAALGAGLVEPWARVCVPAIAGSRLRFQDGLAAGMGATILDLGEELAGHRAAGTAADGGWRAAAALASIQTHLGLLALGRAPAGHVLWPLATEVVRATGLPKPTALAALIPAWLRGIATGAVGPDWGTPDRARAILGLDPGAAAVRLRTWLGGLGLPTQLPATVDVDAVTARVVSPWQASGWFLGGVPRAEIAAVLTAAAG